MYNEEVLKTIETATMKVALKVNNDIEDFIIQSVIQEIGDKTIEVNAKKIAEAIEKQIPKKPTWTERFKTKGNFSMHVTESWCPNCECEVDRDIDNYCSQCGQHLLWEEDND